MSGETCDWPGCSAPSLWRSHHQAWLCDEHDDATIHKYRWAAFSDDELRFLDWAIGYAAYVKSDRCGPQLEEDVTAEMDRRGLLDDSERELRAERFADRAARRRQDEPEWWCVTHGRDFAECQQAGSTNGCQAIGWEAKRRRATVTDADLDEPAS